LHGFDERYERRDALTEQHSDFDWEGLEHRMGEVVYLSHADRTKLAYVLRRFLQWSIDVPANLGPRHSLRLIGRRAVALAWVIEPRLFEDAPSGRQLAKRFRIHPVSMARLTGEASRTFGVRNGSQVHARTGPSNEARYKMDALFTTRRIKEGSQNAPTLKGCDASWGILGARLGLPEMSKESFFPGRRESVVGGRALSV